MWGAGVLYCTVHKSIVHHSAARALSFLFRLSGAKVGAINDDMRVLSILNSFFFIKLDQALYMKGLG